MIECVCVRNIDFAVAVLNADRAEPVGVPLPGSCLDSKLVCAARRGGRA